MGDPPHRALASQSPHLKWHLQLISGASSMILGAIIRQKENLMCPLVKFSYLIFPLL